MNSYFALCRIYLLILLGIVFTCHPELFSQVPSSNNLGTIKIDSNPPDATVIINGEALGKTPFNQKIKPGQKIIEIILDGYSKETATIYLYKKQIINYQFKLKKLDLELDVNIIPADAEIIIDGRKYSNQKEINLFSGIHSFSFERKGYKSQKKWLKLKSGQKVFDITLVKKTTTGAIIRSMILPGWGQVYQEKSNKKYIFPTLFASAAIGSFASIRYYENCLKNYNTSIDNYNISFLESDINRYRNEIKDNYDKANNAKTIRDVLIVTTGIVWLWNILDTIIVPPDWQKDVSLSINQANDIISAQLMLNIR